MSEIKYNQKQIEELLRNKYVKSCTNKNINFTKECKIKSLELCNKWLTTKEIFKDLWFPEYIINSRIPVLSLNRWKSKAKIWQIENKKWRAKKEKTDFEKMTLKEQNEYLKAKIAYLEEVNKYLKGWVP
jgi:hypothetical protein